MEFFKNTYQSTPADEAPAAVETPAEPEKVEVTYPETEPTDTSKFAVTRLNAGKGNVKVPAGKRVEMHYTGTLLDGKKFDSSRDRDSTFKFTLGAGQVIKCWEKGVAELVLGQRAILLCPPEMAYGERGAGGVIPPNATLKFDVEVISF
jgi:peptidylprolyl isomerase